MSRPNTGDQSVAIDNSERIIFDEGDAAADALPVAALVEYDVNGDVAEHDTDGVSAAAAIAGLPFDPAKGLDDTYDAGERTRVYRGLTGTATFVRADADVDAGDYVVPNGAGGVRAAAGDGSEADAYLAQAIGGEGDTHDGLAAVRWF